MSATDELRRMLDERGVEYVLDHEYAEKYPPEQAVTWSSDIAGEDMTVTARDYFIGDGEYCLDLEFHEVFTPAQAVTATLGSCNCSNSERTDVPRLPHFWTHDGTLHVELPKLPESISVRLSDQRDCEVRSARTWQFTRDRGTCHDKNGFDPDTGFECTVCGAMTDGYMVSTEDTGHYTQFNFCPNCGAKVVDE